MATCSFDNYVVYFTHEAAEDPVLIAVIIAIIGVIWLGISLKAQDAKT